MWGIISEHSTCEIYLGPQLPETCVEWASCNVWCTWGEAHFSSAPVKPERTHTRINVRKYQSHGEDCIHSTIWTKLWDILVHACTEISQCDESLSIPHRHCQELPSCSKFHAKCLILWHIRTLQIVVELQERKGLRYYACCFRMCTKQVASGW